MTHIQGILLAAGTGKRFGSHKLLHPLPGGGMIGTTAAYNLINVLPHTLAVIRRGDEQLAEAFEDLGLRIVENNHAYSGMGSSLAVGVSQCSDASGWIIALADMPWISTGTILTMVKGLEQGASICAPVFQGRRGHPVGFGEQWGGRLQALEGDCGARHLLEAYSDELVLIPTDDPGVIKDIDHPADLNKQV